MPSGIGKNTVNQPAHPADVGDDARLGVCIELLMLITANLFAPHHSLQLYTFSARPNIIRGSFIYRMFTYGVT